MALFPLYNSLRISILSTIVIFFTGVFFAYYISKLNSFFKGMCDVLLTLPLVLPPTVVGYFILLVLGPNRPVGKFFMEAFNLRLTMVWPASVVATSIVAFPLMYRAARSSFESFDEYLAESAKCLGISNTRIFWRIRIPNCKSGLIAGTVLSFARGLGEYGATSMVSGYIPGRTANISTTVYHLWQTNNDSLAMKWVLINLAISIFMLSILNIFESKNRKDKKHITLKTLFSR